MYVTGFSVLQLVVCECKPFLEIQSTHRQTTNASIYRADFLAPKDAPYHTLKYEKFLPKHPVYKTENFHSLHLVMGYLNSKYFTCFNVLSNMSWYQLSK